MNKAEVRLIDPEEFLRRRRHKGKLAQHEKLIIELLAKGFSSYMVWRYLAENGVIEVGESTVLRFTRRLKDSRSEGSSGTAATQQHAAELGVPDQATSRLRVSSPPAPGSAGVDAAEGRSSPTDVLTAEAVDHEGGTPEAPLDSNNDDRQPAFTPRADQAEPTLRPLDSIATPPRPGIERYGSV
ncbi:hypothetical protein E1N52_43225 [Paraburkholderia guartelaensis]|uniref:Uncharacterized protein n=1 Tax=Paraburkholderia guartelaensis TaxID=2546446 RepID=A0A4R5KXF8_9BURK|nr:hypothetical protein [Paraburkholderia guartelaensis]TDF99885.1 hypothetical protein E1N52_43225 [Paraburkholderia guartelaensis]